VRIGILGGSYDPIHHGHLIAADALRETLGLDEIRLVVAREQPLKSGQHAASPDDRASMVEIAVRGSPGLVADRSELARGGPSYTVDTVRAFHLRWPDAELVLLLGADAAEELPRWRELETIRSLARLVIFTRGSVAEGDAVVVPRLDISSSRIRERVRAGRSIRFWVPDAVAAYIARGRLYREG
jgi:nicotinate-nucleotide adenylyltransferase